MNTIASNLEEKVKDQLKYEPWRIPQQLFKNLIGICILNKIPVKKKGKRVTAVQIQITRGKEDVGPVWAKPFVKNDRLMISFRSDTAHTVDASLIFGEKVQEIK